MRKCLLLVSLYLVCFYQHVLAQNLIKSIPLQHARYFTTDEMGNAYVLFEDNSIVKYNDKGDSLFNYRSINNGTVQSIDASNPFKVLVYYADYSKIVALDRVLSLINELDLRSLHIFPIASIAYSYDGNYWIYDLNNAQLLKIDQSLNILTRSNDVRTSLGTYIEPSFILDRNRKVYLCDTSVGVAVFDQYGGTLNSIQLPEKLSRFQIFDNTFVYQDKDSLVSYNTKTGSIQALAIPVRDTNFIEARIEQDRLYHLYHNKLEYYQLKQ